MSLSSTKGKKELMFTVYDDIISDALLGRAVGVGVAAWVLLGGCVGEPPRGSAAMSEGPWRIEAEPVVVIGGDDGHPESLFDLIYFVELVDDERVVVIDRSRTIRVFNLDGDLLQRFAGPGEGPAEIRQFIGAWITPPDTVHVIDGLARQVKSFLMDGTHQESRAMDMGGVRAAVFVGAFRDGGFVSWGGGREEGDGDVVREIKEYHHFDPGGEYVGVLTRQHHRVRYSSDPQSGSGQTLPPGAAGLTLEHPLSAHANALIRDDTIFYTDGLRPEITVLTKEGAVARTVQLPQLEIPYSEARSALRTALGRGGDERGIALLDGAPELDSVPQTAGMLMDDEGLLWVKKFDPVTDAVSMRLRRLRLNPYGGEWWVVDRTGNLRATVSLPDRFIPMDISTSFIAGITVDEFEVERVVVHRIVNRR